MVGGAWAESRRSRLTRARPPCAKCTSGCSTGLPFRSGPEGAATPHEFERLLVAALPEHAEQFRTITREYVNARYSGVAPTEDELNSVKYAWRMVRKG